MTYLKKNFNIFNLRKVYQIILFSFLFLMFLIFVISIYIELYGTITKEFKYYIFDVTCRFGYHPGLKENGIYFRFRALHIPEISFFLSDKEIDAIKSAAINEYASKYPNALGEGDINGSTPTLGEGDINGNTPTPTPNIKGFQNNHKNNPVFHDMILGKCLEYFYAKFNTKPVAIKEFYSILDQYVDDFRNSKKKFILNRIKNVIPFPELMYEAILRNQNEICPLIIEYRNSLKIFFWCKYTDFSALFWHYAYIIFDFVMYFVKHK